MHLAKGTIVDGRYEVITPLGIGGFGAVYKAKHLLLDRLVALKMMHSLTDLDETAQARFDREARILSQLHHKNLAGFHGYGVWEESPYMVLECIEGRSLQAVLADDGALPEKRTLNIIKQMCEALSCVHAADVIHRDLKPSNVMVAPGDVVKLIDFGLISFNTVSGAAVQKLTQAGSTVGTAQYMSPEQCLGQDLDARSDIYSLACIMQYCLTGEPPFNADSSVSLMQAHVSEVPISLETRLPKGSFSPPLQLVLNRALAKDRESRYESIAEMQHDVVQLQQRTTDNLLAGNAKTPEALHIVASNKKRNRILASVAIAGLVVAGICSGFYFSRSPAAKSGPVAASVSGSSRRLLAHAYALSDADKTSQESVDAFNLALAANVQDHNLSLQLTSRARQRLAYTLRKRKDFDQSYKVALIGINDRMESGEADESLGKLCQDCASSAGSVGHTADVASTIEKAAKFYEARTGQRSLLIMTALAKCAVFGGDRDLTKARIKELEPLVVTDDKLRDDLRNIKKNAKKAGVL